MDTEEVKNKSEGCSLVISASASICCGSLQSLHHTSHRNGPTFHDKISAERHRLQVTHLKQERGSDYRSKRLDCYTNLLKCFFYLTNVDVLRFLTIKKDTK